MAICENPRIQGIDTKTRQFKMPIYADDMLLYIRNHEASFPVILETIASYGTLSGYKVNWGKMEVLPLNHRCFRSMFQGAPVQWTPKGLKYLGITFGPDLPSTIVLLHKVIKQAILTATEQWSPLFISWWGEWMPLKWLLLHK